MNFFGYKTENQYLEKNYLSDTTITLFRIFSFCYLLLFLPGQLYSQTVAVDIKSEKQIIRGFGGANIPVWIDDLTPDQIDKAFGNDPGQIGMSILRIRIPYDTNDFYKELPAALRAQSYGAIVIASPWTPPPHMKTSNNIVGGSLKPSSYADYAAHLKRFVNYMHNNGAPLYAVSIQNEPDVPPVDYESCDWTPQEMINFLKNYGDSIGNVKIIAAESFNFNPAATDPILNDPAAESKVDIIGVHVYGSGHKNYPLAIKKGKEIWITEHFTKSSKSANNWEYAMMVAHDIHKCMVTNCNTYIWWYIRRFYGPIDDFNMVTKRGYIISQYSKFVRPGYVRIDVPENPLEYFNVTAYKEDNDVVIVAINRYYHMNVTLNFTIPGININSLKKYTTSEFKNFKYEGKVINNNGSFSVQFDSLSITTLSTSEPQPVIPAFYSFPKHNILLLKNKGEFEYSVYDLTGKLIEKGIGNLKTSTKRKFVTGTYIIKSKIPAQNNSLKVLNF